jgi:hypothetical protein
MQVKICRSISGRRYDISLYISGRKQALLIEALRQWRGEMLAGIRELVRAAEPDVVEAKWRKPSNALLVETKRACAPNS